MRDSVSAPMLKGRSRVVSEASRVKLKVAIRLCTSIYSRLNCRFTSVKMLRCSYVGVDFRRGGGRKGSRSLENGSSHTKNAPKHVYQVAEEALRWSDVSGSRRC